MGLFLLHIELKIKFCLQSDKENIIIVCFLSDTEITLNFQVVADNIF